MARPALPKNKALSRQVAVRFREGDYRQLQRFRMDAIRAGKLGRGASFSDAVRLALESYLGGETATVDGPDRLAFTSGRPRAGRMDTRAVAKRIVKRVREAARPQLDEALLTKTAAVVNARKQRVLVVLRALDRELDQLDANDRIEIERHASPLTRNDPVALTRMGPPPDQRSRA